MKMVSKCCKAALNLLLILIFIFPFYWMLITAFKTLGETTSFPPSLFPQIHSGRISLTLLR